jgi:hypothetical protein
MMKKCDIEPPKKRTCYRRCLDFLLPQDSDKIAARPCNRDCTRLEPRSRIPVSSSPTPAMDAIHFITNQVHLLDLKFDRISRQRAKVSMQSQPRTFVNVLTLLVSIAGLRPLTVSG